MRTPSDTRAPGSTQAHRATWTSDATSASRATRPPLGMRRYRRMRPASSSNSSYFLSLITPFNAEQSWDVPERPATARCPHVRCDASQQPCGSPQRGVERPAHGLAPPVRIVRERDADGDAPDEVQHGEV